MARIASLIVVMALAACTTSQQVGRLFTRDDFARLRFLEGRWKGVAPDGSAFFEEYDFPEPGTLRSRRYPDAGFNEPGDGSTVVFDDGSVISKWRHFTWKAVEIAPDRVCFDPVEAPSSFCWIRKTDSLVEVTQRWTDEKGQEQTYSVPLERVR